LVDEGGKGRLNGSVQGDLLFDGQMVIELLQVQGGTSKLNGQGFDRLYRQAYQLGSGSDKLVVFLVSVYHEMGQEKIEVSST